MAKWFYYNESGEKVEVTGGQLKGLAKAGMITPDTIVETEEGKSAPARRVKGLTFAKTDQRDSHSGHEDAIQDTVKERCVPADAPAIAPIPPGNQKGLSSVPVPIAEPMLLNTSTLEISDSQQFKHDEYKRIAKARRLFGMYVAFILPITLGGGTFLDSPLLDLYELKVIFSIPSIIFIILAFRFARSCGYNLFVCIMSVIIFPLLFPIYLDAGSHLKQAGYKIGFIWIDMRQFDTVSKPTIVQRIKRTLAVIVTSTGIKAKALGIKAKALQSRTAFLKPYLYLAVGGVVLIWISEIVFGILVFIAIVIISLAVVIAVGVAIYYYFNYFKKGLDTKTTTTKQRMTVIGVPLICFGIVLCLIGNYMQSENSTLLSEYNIASNQSAFIARRNADNHSVTAIQEGLKESGEAAQRVADTYRRLQNNSHSPTLIVMLFVLGGFSFVGGCTLLVIRLVIPDQNKPDLNEKQLL